jgi:hypothetical protein
MIKDRIVNEARRVLRERLERLAKAAIEAHAAATDPGSKAEGKYDTRSLEASYLATGQARQVEDLADTVRVFDQWEPRDFEPDEAIGAGALVQVEVGAEELWFLLAPAAGGSEISVEGMEVTMLAPASGLYQSLLGKRVGDILRDGQATVLEVL